MGCRKLRSRTPGRFLPKCRRCFGDVAVGARRSATRQPIGSPGRTNSITLRYEPVVGVMSGRLATAAWLALLAGGGLVNVLRALAVVFRPLAARLRRGIGLGLVVVALAQRLGAGRRGDRGGVGSGRPLSRPSRARNKTAADRTRHDERLLTAGQG